MFNQTFTINQILNYPRLVLSQNGKDSAIPAVDDDHLGYIKLFSNFRTSLISFAICFLSRGMFVSFA